MNDKTRGWVVIGAATAYCGILLAGILWDWSAKILMPLAVLAFVLAMYHIRQMHKRIADLSKKFDSSSKP